MRISGAFGSIFLAVAASGPVLAVNPSVVDFDFRAAGVSDNGTVVVGAGLYDAWRWTSTSGASMLPRPNGTVARAWGVSGDGSVTVGALESTVNENPVFQPFLWTESNGLTLLGEEVFGEARSISGDGSAVAGWDPWTNFSWRWTVGTGVQELGGGEAARIRRARPSGLSYDGSVIVGTGFVEGGEAEAFRWTEAGGIQGLGVLSGVPNAYSFAEDVSADGRVVVGDGLSTRGREAFRWEDGVLTALGDLPGGNFQSSANAVNGDGSVIVGSASLEGGSVAFIWDEIHGMRRLRDVLAQDHGIDTSGVDLSIATDISADGRYIVGTGSTGGWLVAIPEPSAAALATIAMTTVLARRRR